jgi:hypothetical protein
MASNTPTPAAEPAEPKYTLEDAIKLIAQSMAQQTALQAQVAANTPKRRKTMEEYLAENPEKKLLHETFQNGRPVNPSGLSAATIRLLDTLAPGVYADGLLSVARVTDGPNGINTRIHIFYSNKEIGERMNFYMRFPTFTSIVKTIAEEMVVNGKKPIMDESAVDLAPLEASEVKKASEKKTK